MHPPHIGGGLGGGGCFFASFFAPKKVRTKRLSWNFSLEILSPLIGAALKQGSVAKQLVNVIVIKIINYQLSIINYFFVPLHPIIKNIVIVNVIVKIIINY